MAPVERLGLSFFRLAVTGKSFSPQRPQRRAAKKISPESRDKLFTAKIAKKSREGAKEISPEYRENP
jgi:hypothetical protein